MMIYRKHIILFILSAIVIFLLPRIGPAFAHSLEESSAQITLRDGQIEVRILTDMQHWQSTLKSHQAWLMQETDAVMPDDLTEAQAAIFIKDLLREKTKISLNNTAITLDNILIHASPSKNPHHSTEIVLTGRHRIPHAEQIDIQFPKSLGPVYTSFVKPKYKMMPAGTSTTVMLSDTSAEHHEHSNHRHVEH